MACQRAFCESHESAREWRLPLLTHQQPKTIKGEDQGTLTAVLHFKPSRKNCPHWSEGCRCGCLNCAGRGGIFAKGCKTNAIQRARARRSRLFWSCPKRFGTKLAKEIEKHRTRAHKLGMLPAVRLNGTSDLPWESIYPEIFARFTDVQFYDYTADFNRMALYIAENIEGTTATRSFPANYDLTFSRKETNGPACRLVLEHGGNVAVVFRHHIPAIWEGYRVIDGRISDRRFADPRPCVVGLIALGPARKDRTGFVVG